MYLIFTSFNTVIYKVGYLTVLAWMRIVALTMPLLFHSYTGTALPCLPVFVGWYVVTLAVILSHLLALCLVVPESLQALVPEPEGAGGNREPCTTGTLAAPG